MSWTSIWKYYGLKRPFDFKVAIPFLMGGTELLLVFAVFSYMMVAGGVSIGTERFYFFSYITILLVIAAVSAKKKLLSSVIVAWCAVELGVVLLSGFLEIYGVGASLLPRNIITPPPSASPVLGPRFRYHPFLQVVPTPNWHETVRLVDARNFKEWRRVVGMNAREIVDRDFVFDHNSLGLRGPELTEANLDMNLIFVYGGSTTYDWTVTQGLTWVEQLQSKLADKYTVLNFGVPNHSTVEHLIYTTFYQDLVGKYPVCAVYYVGWNDLISSHVDRMDPTYSNYHALYEVVRKREIWLARYSPLLRLGYREISERIDSIPPYSMPPVSEASGFDARLKQIFVQNIETITAINAHRGVKTIVIGQLLNRELLSEFGDARGAFFVVKGKYTWRMQEEANSVLRRVATSQGAKYIDAGVENFTADDFSDFGHFTAAGSSKFANRVLGEVKAFCDRPTVMR